MEQRAISQTAAPGGYPANTQALLILSLLVLAYIVSFVDRMVLSLMVNPIKADLGVSDFQMSLLQGFAFAVVYCLLGLPCGRLADRYSRKLIIASGILLWSLMTVLCGLAGNYATLFIARMGVGIGEATLAPAGYSMLADTFRKERLVWATSIFAMGAMLGGALAFLAGGVVIDYVSNTAAAPFGLQGLRPWQATFIIVGLPGILVALLMLLIQEPTRKGAGEDVPLSLGNAFAQLWSRRRYYAPLYISGILLAVLSNIGLSWFPTHMIRAFGLSASEAGLLLGLLQLAGPVAGAALGAHMTSRFAARGHTDAPLLTVTAVAAAAALTFLAPLMPTVETAAALWLVSLVFQSAYYGNLMGALQMITPKRLRATNAALLTIAVIMGGLALGTALVGGIADTFFPGDARGIGNALAIVGIGCGAAAALVAAWGRPSLREAMARATQI